MSERYTASTITDDALDVLYRRIDTLEAVAAGNKRHVQLIVPALQRAEAAIERGRHIAALIEAGAPWTANHDETARRIRAALDGEQSKPGTATTEDACCNKPAGAVCVHDVSVPKQQPREHCGDLKPYWTAGPRTECVLPPGHAGSHADDHGARWWYDPLVAGFPCTCGGRFPLQHIHADDHQPKESTTP